MIISAYRTMWLMVYFDLPVDTKEDRFNYSKFRKALLKDGFFMHQYSVYIRHCVTLEAMESHINKVVSNLPKYGKISLIQITDKQFENIKHYWGRSAVPSPIAPRQLEIF